MAEIMFDGKPLRLTEWTSCGGCAAKWGKDLLAGLVNELPASVELTVTYTEPGLQGDRSSGGNKPATVETGIQVQVPLFIKQDEKIMVDTRDGSYQGRAN